jgi:hypothetical protein
MTGWQLVIAGALYAWVAFDFAAAGRWGMVLAFTAYAVANAGFIWDARQ